MWPALQRKPKRHICTSECECKKAELRFDSALDDLQKTINDRLHKGKVIPIRKKEVKP